LGQMRLAGKDAAPSTEEALLRILRRLRPRFFIGQQKMKIKVNG